MAFPMNPRFNFKSIRVISCGRCWESWDAGCVGGLRFIGRDVCGSFSNTDFPTFPIRRRGTCHVQQACSQCPLNRSFPSSSWKMDWRKNIARAKSINLWHIYDDTSFFKYPSRQITLALSLSCSPIRLFRSFLLSTFAVSLFLSLRKDDASTCSRRPLSAV